MNEPSIKSPLRLSRLVCFTLPALLAVLALLCFSRSLHTLGEWKAMGRLEAAWRLHSMPHWRAGKASASTAETPPSSRLFHACHSWGANAK